MLEEHLGACRESLEDGDRGCRVLLLGEDNPQSASPEHALYDYPPNCAGERLRRLILDIPSDRYLSIWRTNLCNPTWSEQIARRRALELALDDTWDTIIMVGRKVARAMASVDRTRLSKANQDPLEPFEVSPRYFRGDTGRWVQLVSLPHPSGRNLIWNNPDARETARRIVRDVAPELYA